mgnify:CR=1 FL=1
MKKFLLLMLLAPAALSAAADSGADASVVVRKDSAFVEKHRFLPTAKRIDRRIDRNKFAYKGEVALGITASYGTISSDDTDMMLAIKLGLSRGYREFAIYGGLGGRLDHTIANIQSLTYLAGEGAAGILYGDSYALTVIKDSSFTVPKDATGMVSVFSLSDSSENVSIKGLKYEVDGVTLTNAFPLGVSNETTAKKGIISVGSGTLLILWHP